MSVDVMDASTISPDHALLTIRWWLKDRRYSKDRRPLPLSGERHGGSGQSDCRKVAYLRAEEKV